MRDPCEYRGRGYSKLGATGQGEKRPDGALGVSVEAVFKARSNVTKLLREEMKKMEE